jgi:hypothetical protein
MDGIDAEKPVGLTSALRPGIYIVNIRTAERQLVKGRFAIVK